MKFREPRSRIDQQRSIAALDQIQVHRGAFLDPPHTFGNPRHLEPAVEVLGARAEAHRGQADDNARS
jgi:hypothetical protein